MLKKLSTPITLKIVFGGSGYQRLGGGGSVWEERAGDSPTLEEAACPPGRDTRWGEGQCEAE